MRTLVVVDWGDAFCAATRAEFAAEVASGAVRVLQCDVRDIEPSGTAFVSPANSLLFFDGGYDDALRRKFPGLQRRCQARLPELGFRTAIGRHYLLVGSALVSPTGPDSCVIAAPTMFLPHDVSGTCNAYHALMAALMAIDGYDGSRQTSEGADPLGSPLGSPLEGVSKGARPLVVPAMCCGYGRMAPAEAARQMHEALRDFEDGVRPPRVACFDDPTLFVGPSRDAEQPRNFDNREIKVVDVADIKYVGTGSGKKTQAPRETSAERNVEVL